MTRETDSKNNENSKKEHYTMIILLSLSLWLSGVDILGLVPRRVQLTVLGKSLKLPHVLSIFLDPVWSIWL